jgi:hypothetical protein
MLICAASSKSCLESGESVRFLTDRCHRGLKFIALRRPGLGELDLGFDDRHRGTQLVAGIGEELSLLLQCIPLHGLRLPNAVEHVVQRVSQASDLVFDR